MARLAHLNRGNFSQQVDDIPHPQVLTIAIDDDEIFLFDVAAVGELLAQRLQGEIRLRHDHFRIGDLQYAAFGVQRVAVLVGEQREESIAAHHRHGNALFDHRHAAQARVPAKALGQCWHQTARRDALNGA